MFTKVFIPYRGYYSSPFCRWQGKMANDNAIVLGANTARRWMAQREIDSTVIDYLYYGTTVAQWRMFHSHNWASAIMQEDKKNV
ncbi:MAG: thiolase family protein, partial [Candidatus Aminicenantes bacterium]|nr:thiolase family protein [Candidatus Aminicenantes bacterium]